MVPRLPPEIITCTAYEQELVDERYKTLLVYSLVDSTWRALAQDRLVEVIRFDRADYTVVKLTQLKELLEKNNNHLAKRVKSHYIWNGKSLDTLPIMTSLQDLYIHSFSALLWDWLKQGKSITGHQR